MRLHVRAVARTLAVIVFVIVLEATDSDTVDTNDVALLLAAAHKQSFGASTLITNVRHRWLNTVFPDQNNVYGRASFGSTNAEVMLC